MCRQSKSKVGRVTIIKDLDNQDPNSQDMDSINPHTTPHHRMLDVPKPRFPHLLIQIYVSMNSP